MCFVCDVSAFLAFIKPLLVLWNNVKIEMEKQSARTINKYK